MRFLVVHQLIFSFVLIFLSFSYKLQSFVKALCSTPKLRIQTTSLEKNERSLYLSKKKEFTSRTASVTFKVIGALLRRHLRTNVDAATFIWVLNIYLRARSTTWSMSKLNVNIVITFTLFGKCEVELNLWLRHLVLWLIDEVRQL